MSKCVSCSSLKFFDSSDVDPKCTCEISEKEYIQLIQLFVRNLGITIKFNEEICLASYIKLMRKICSTMVNDAKESEGLLHLVEKYKKTYVRQYLDVGWGRGYRLDLVKKNYHCGIFACDTKKYADHGIKRKVIYDRTLQGYVFTIISSDEIKYPPNYFHLITCVNFLNNFCPKLLSKICLELYRVLHRDGILIIKEYDCCDYKTYFNLVTAHEFLRKSGVIDKNPGQFLSRKIVETSLKDALFKIVHSTLANDVHNYTLVLKK